MFKVLRRLGLSALGLWLIVRCPYCHALARLPEKEARLLTAHIRLVAAGEAFRLAVADRIEAGYAAP